MKVRTRFVLLNRNKGKNDLCTISLRIGYKRKYAFWDTGIEVLQEQFHLKDANNGHWQIILKHPRGRDLNQRLKIVLDRVFDIHQSLFISGEDFSAFTIKSKLRTEGKSAIEVFKLILEEERSLSDNTKKAFNSLIAWLVRFNSNTLVNEINNQFVKRFEGWLLLQKNKRGTKFKTSSINKYIDTLSKFMDLCVKNEIIDKNKINNYELIRNIEAPKKVYLTFEELSKVEQYDFSQNFSGAKLKSINLTRDAFLFACYTGLRINSLIQVCKKDLEENILTAIVEKGKKPKVTFLPVELLFHGKPLQLIEKYSRHRFNNVPLFSDLGKGTHQSNIRIIRSIIIPSKKITFHSGRHTFSTLLLEMGFNANTVQRYLGHSNVKTTLNFYDHHSWSKEFKETEKRFSLFK